MPQDSQPDEAAPAGQQCADAVFMVKPAAFGFNPEAAATNTFQKPPASQEDSGARARAEFEALHQALVSEGVTVLAAQDTQQPPKPDAVFPNNWVSFHHDGTLVLYPMQCRNRRSERRTDLIEEVARSLPFQVSHLLDLSYFEEEGKYLEGTGSLVLDHLERVAYAALSPRTHPEVVREWAQELGYEAVTFAAANRAGVPLYHTNVALCIGARMAVVGTEAIAPGDRGRVLERLARADVR